MVGRTHHDDVAPQRFIAQELEQCAKQISCYWTAGLIPALRQVRLIDLIDEEEGGGETKSQVKGLLEVAFRGAHHAAEDAGHAQRDGIKPKLIGSRLHKEGFPVARRTNQQNPFGNIAPASIT